MSTVPPTTAVPTTTVPTTVVPTTIAPTTIVPTTIVSTVVPTTLVPTTLAPTPPPIDLDFGPIEITLSFYHILHYNPPAPFNEGLNQEGNFGPIEIVISVEGYNKDFSTNFGSIDLNITVHHSGILLGIVLDFGHIDLVISVKPTSIIIQLPRCNFVKWSKIGVLDFTIDESNLAGERPVDWAGCIWHLHKLDDRMMAYGENGVSIFKPSGVHWGMDTIYPIGLKNKGAFAGSKNMHFFVDNLGQLFKVDSKLSKFDYSEFLSEMGTIILSLDTEKRLLYICDGSIGYIFGIDSGSLGEGPVNISGFGVRSNTLYVVSDGEISTPKFEICTDIYDFGTRNYKTIREVEFGTNLTDFLYASVDYRNSYKDTFKQIGWFLVNPDGRAHPRCYGSEFRFRLKSTVYEYFELDYIKIKGHIHGWLGFTYSGTSLAAGTSQKESAE